MSAAPVGLRAGRDSCHVARRDPRTHYHVQAGKLQLRVGVGPAVLAYKDSGLTSRVTYTCVVTAWNDCNGNGAFDAGVDTESAVSNQASATAQ